MKASKPVVSCCVSAMKLCLGSVVVPLLLVAAPLSAADPVEDLCARITVTGVGGSEDDIRAGGGPHSARQIIDLRFEVSLQGKLDGDRVLELEVYTPHRNLYQVLTAPISTDKGRSNVAVPVAGYPKPLPVQVLAPVTGLREYDDGWMDGASLDLPVAGTLIVQNSLYGTWEIKVKVDGQSMSCSRRYLFDLGE